LQNSQTRRNRFRVGSFSDGVLLEQPFADGASSKTAALQVALLESAKTTRQQFGNNVAPASFKIPRLSKRPIVAFNDSGQIKFKAL